MPTATSDAPASVLTPELLRVYRDDGFVVLRGLFHPAEMALVSMEADRLLARRDLMHTNNIRCRWQPHRETGECLFETFDPVIDLSPTLAALARDERLMAALETIYGEPAHLFKDKLIFKPAGAKGHDLHQDWIGWPGFPETFVTAAIAIDPATRENGCTVFYPGYHHAGYLSPIDGDYHPLSTDAVDEGRAVALEMQPGDVALFGAFVPHRSDPNASPASRRLLYLSYNADSDGGDRRDRHYAEFHEWLRGKYADFGKHETYFA